MDFRRTASRTFRNISTGGGFRYAHSVQARSIFFFSFSFKSRIIFGIFPSYFFSNIFSYTTVFLSDCLRCVYSCRNHIYMTGFTSSIIARLPIPNAHYPSAFLTIIKYICAHFYHSFQNKTVFTVDKNNIKLNKDFSLFGSYNKSDVNLATNTDKLKELVSGFNALQNSTDTLGTESYTKFLSTVRNESDALADSMTTLAATSNTAQMTIADAFDATYGGTSGLSNVKKLVESYNALGDGTNVQTAAQKNLADQISITNKRFGSYINGLNGAEASIAGYGVQLVAAKVKTIALTAASAALNAAISFGVSIAISAIISGIASLVNAQEEARKKAVEASKAYEDQKKQIEDLKNKYIEIMDSEKDEATKAKELDSIKNTLAETYGVEKEALDKLNESRQAGLDLMDEESEVDLNKYLNDNKDAYDAAVNKFDNVFNSKFDRESDLFSIEWVDPQKYNEVFKELSNFGITGSYDKSKKKQTMILGKDAKESYENVEKAITFFNDKKRQGTTLTAEEKGALSALNESKKYFEDNFFNDENGSYDLIETYTKALWEKYEREFVKDGHKALDDIDNLTDLKDWLNAFLTKNEGLMGTNPHLGTYILDTVIANKKKEIQKVATETEQAITYPTVNVTELNTKLEETSEKLDKITTSASKVQSALKSAFSKESFNVDDVLSLIELMPELADKLKMNDDGTFSINYKDLQSGAESYIKTQKQEVDTTNELIEAKIKELEANIALNKSRLLTSVNSKYDDEYNQNIKSAISTDESNLATLKSQLSEGKVKSEYLAKSAEDLSASFSAVIDVLTNRYEVITDVEDAISDNGSITLDTLNKVKEVYPELSDEVSNYMMGLIDEQSLLSKLKDAYDDDFYEYRSTIARKIDLTDEELQTYLNALNTKYLEDENYYTHLGATSKNFVDYMANNYGVDLKNCSTWYDAKRRLHDKYISNIEATGLGLNIEDYYDFDNAKWKDGAEGELAQIQMNSPKEFSEVMSKVYAVLDDYGQGMEEFGNLFKSTRTLEAVSSKSNRSSKKNSTKSTTSEIFDWIEVRLNRLADKTKSFFDKVSDYVSNITNERNLGKAITATQNEINANKKAEQKYRQKANSINLSESWKKKVREGNFSINELTNETLIKNIQDYQKWWEKARDSAQNVADLSEQKKDYLSQQFDSKYERQQRITDKYSTANDKINDIISYKENKGGKVSAGDYNNLNRNLTSQNKSLSIQNKMLLQQQKTVQKGSAKWQEYKEKIDANSQSIRQNTIAIVENNNKKFDLKISDYERSAGNHERTITNVQSSMDLAKAQGKKTGDSYYRYMINTSKMQNTVLQKERNAIFNERKTVQYGSERYDELTEKLRNVDDQISENNKNQAEWNATIRDLPMDRINEYLDVIESYISEVKSAIEMQEYINGESTISAEDVRSQKYSADALSNQKTLYEDYYNEWQKAKKEGRTADVDKYTKLYYEGLQSYNEMLKANEELDRQARDIELYRNYEKDLQHIEDVKKALSSLSDMINDDALYNDDGSFSEHGIAKIALTMKNLEEAKSSVYDYKKEIDALDKAHKQGKYNDDEYAEKLRELTDGYQNATSEVNNYTEAIKDLYKNQAQEELNALNELIDLRSQALQKKKEYYDYDKTIRNKTKDITAMQMQIEALNGVSTAESKAQKALLEEQLSDLKEDLADTQADHIYQVQVDGLNEQKEILQDIYDKFVDSLNKCLDTEKDIVNSASSLATNSIEAVNKLLRDIANARGFDISYIEGAQNSKTIPHFANGGRVVTIDSKGRDDGIAWLKAGEIVLTKEISNAFMKTIPQLNLLSVDLKKTLSHGQTTIGSTPSVSLGDIQLIVQGSVDRDVMDDLKKYQKQITDSVITNITKDLRKVGYKR